MKEINKTIDIIKGIGIVLVILGHISSTPKITKTRLYTFHIPLFFFCSGYVFSVNGLCFKDFLFKRIRTIALPIISLGFCLWIANTIRDTFFWKFSEGKAPNYSPLKVIIAQLLGYRLHKSYYSLWFLYALFLGEVIFFFIQKYLVTKPQIIFIISFVSVFIYKYLFSNIQGWYWSLDVVPAVIAFLSLGYIFRSYHIIEKKFVNIWLLPITLAGNLFFGMLNYRIIGDRTDLYYCRIGNPLFYYLSALFGIFTTIITAKLLGCSVFFEYTGKNSLIIYAFNKFSIKIGKDLAQYLKLRHELFNNNIFLYCLTVLTAIILSALLVEIINHFFPLIIGKRKSISEYPK